MKINRLSAALSAALLFCLLPCSLPARAESPVLSSGDDVLAELGRVNGISLACQQPALAARARDLVIEWAPKERAQGEMFEQATSQAFLQQGKNGLPCPEVKALIAQLGALEFRLKSRFPKVP